MCFYSLLLPECSAWGWNGLGGEEELRKSVWWGGRWGVRREVGGEIGGGEGGV